MPTALIETPSTYQQVKSNASFRIEQVPMFFAFSNEQFEEGKRKLGVSDDKELCKVGSGGFMKATDTYLLDEAFKANEEELNAFLASDEGLLSALRYELNNHEYGYTHDWGTVEEVCEMFGLEWESNKQAIIRHAIDLAIKDYNECN